MSSTFTHLFVHVIAALFIFEFVRGESPSLTISEEGAEEQYYLSPNDGDDHPEIVYSGRGLKVAYGNRYYLMKNPNKPHSSSNREDFKLIQLVGKTINVTVDLNGASCGCNAAFYLVSMPSMTGSGKANDWYCDANNVGGEACPEVDLIEANQNAIRTTMHPCSKPWTAGSCNAAGYGISFGQGSKDFGIGSSFSVDTTKPFIFSNSFVNDTETLRSVVKIIQGGVILSKTFKDIHDVAEPLQDGMVLAISFWGSTDMHWLDSPPCGADSENCPSSVTFSDIQIASHESPSPSPGPSPTPAPKNCPPSDPSHCDCSWTKSGAACGADDGSECFCRCCCIYEEPNFHCKWQPPLLQRKPLWMEELAKARSTHKAIDIYESRHH